MKSSLYVVRGKLVTRAMVLSALERITLYKALAVVLAKGGCPEDCRLYRRLHLRIAHSLGMRFRGST